ncbi:MAG: acyl-CoA synthetase [Bacteroidota bacterium]
MIQLIEHASQNSSNQAIISDGKSYNYHQLLHLSESFASILLSEKPDLEEARVAFMVGPGLHYVVAQWGIWRAGGVAVPLCISYPISSLQYVLEDTGANIIVVAPEFEPILSSYCQENNLRLVVITTEVLEKAKPIALPNIAPERRAMILYTSGTTNLPKGVVTLHCTIEAQISTLVEAWKWSSTDHILCVLPLHHVHGIINVISCALWAGATVEFLPKFSEEAVFEAFSKGKINLFMAVPTIYFKLIAFWEKQTEEKQKEISKVLSKFRLMVSGSAALPVSVMEKWQKISGHTLLERYGMTEIGMGVSNPYKGERKAGFIGMPLPGVQIRLVDEQNKNVEADQAGEIQVKGASVFTEYWNKPEATQKTFTEDGWFKTGDIAVVENGYIKILGRDSVDIIKSGGYKISALEIEEILRQNTSIVDCSVLGLPDEEWGEIVGAALILNDKSVDIKQLNTWLRERLPGYKCPRIYKVIDELPKNAMGKVVKPDLKKLFI